MLLRATETFIAFTASGQRVVAKGSIVDDSDPVVAKRAELFVPVDVTFATVEQATAAPGEKRATRSRKPKAKAADLTPADPEIAAEG